MERPSTIVIQNRRDHYIPQGYLRGFIDPERRNQPQPLWYFDKPNGTWSKRSPSEIGYRYGFYDYSVSEMGTQTADQAFAESERNFPKVRKELVRDQFKNWRDHLDFLLRFAHMMRARSLLFFENQQKEGRNLRALVVEKVSPDRMSVKVRSMTPEPLPESFIKTGQLRTCGMKSQRGRRGWLN